MDLASVATSLSNANLSNQVQVSVARKVLDSEQQQGAAAVELINTAAGGGDSDNGLGGAVDVQG